MASSIQLARAAAAQEPRNPLALWHLLSLDAPTVAALWSWFVARCIGIELPAAVVAAMFVAVWILYAADRLLDARLLNGRVLNARQLDARDPDSAPRPPTERLEARHLFHHRHRPLYRTGIVFAAVLLAALVPRLSPTALRFYTVEASVLLAWFLVLHATPFAHRLPKEFVVGLFFAAAVFTPALARRPELRLALLPPLVLFVALVTLNCLFIYTWEHTGDSTPAHTLTRLAAARVTPIALATTAAAAALALRTAPSALSLLSIALAAAAALLLVLHRTRHRLDATTLRAAADLALLTPLLLAPFLR